MSRTNSAIRAPCPARDIRGPSPFVVTIGHGWVVDAHGARTRNTQSASDLTEHKRLLADLKGNVNVTEHRHLLA